MRLNGHSLMYFGSIVEVAIDFWMKAGHSSAEGVFGKALYPVHANHVYKYLDSDEEDQTQRETNTDYRRRIKRTKDRNKLLTAIPENQTIIANPLCS